MRHLTGKVVLVVLAMSLALMPLASQTSPEQKPSFEPVTIKRAAYGQSAKKLIGYGYQVHDFQIVGGPDWAGTDLWDIQSKTVEGNAPPPPIADLTPPGPFALMVQSILQEHFQLKIHREVRELPVYELVVAQGGPKLADDQIDTRVPDGLYDLKRGTGRIWNSRGAMGVEARAIPMDWLANILTHPTGRTVIDKTGLHGLYDVDMEWMPDAQGAPATSLIRAIEEQLGLRLESTTGPVEVIVIDHVERPSEN